MESQKQIEIFLCSVIINSLEIDSFRSKRIFAHFQLNDMPLLNITNFNLSEGKSQVELYTGIQFIVRLNCLDSFKTCPAYIYFDNQQNQTICACGLDLTSLIVDSYRNSNSGKPELYQTNLVLHNRYDKEVGIGNFLFTCLHFSKDVNNAKSCVNFIEERKPTEETTGAIAEDIQLGDHFLKSVCTMARVPRRQTPIMKDLLVLSNTYQKTRSIAINEVENLENEIRTIEAKNNVKIQKRRQEKRRMKEPFENVEDTNESIHTSDFSYFENSSDYSESQRVNQAFNNCEEKCGISHTFHFKHHGHKEKPKHHHHHHHSQKEVQEENPSTAPIPQQTVSSNKQQSQSSNKVSDSKDKSTSKEKTSNKTQHDFDAFIRRQQAAAEKKKSFMSNSGIDNKSGISQTSTASKKRTKKAATQKKPIETSTTIPQSQHNEVEKKPANTQPIPESTFATEVLIQNPIIPSSNLPKEPKQDSEMSKNEESNNVEVIDFGNSEIDQKEDNNRQEASDINEKSESSTKELSDMINDTDKRNESNKEDTTNFLDSEINTAGKNNESNNESTIDFGDTEKEEKNDKTDDIDISGNFISYSDGKSSQDPKSQIETISAIEESIIESDAKNSAHSSPSSNNDIEPKSDINNKSSTRISFTGSLGTSEIDDGDAVDIEPNSIPSPTSNILDAKETGANETKENEKTDKYTDSSIGESFISKNEPSDEEDKKPDLNDLDIEKLLAETDTDKEPSSLTSDFKNILGTDFDSPPPPPVQKTLPVPKFDAPKKDINPVPPKQDDASSQIDSKSRRMSSLSGIDIDFD